MHDRRQNTLQGVLHPQKKAKCQASNQKEQACLHFCWDFMAICSFSGAVFTRIGPRVLCNLSCCSNADYDPSMFGNVFLVTESTKIRRQKEKVKMLKAGIGHGGF